MFWGLPKRFGNISTAELWFVSVLVRPCMALAAWPSNKECKWLNLSIKLKCWFTWIALLKLSPKFWHCVNSPQNFGNASLGSFALGWLDIKLAFVLKLVNDWEVVSKTNTEARSTQISKTKHLSKTKHPNLENEAPKNSKTKTPKNSKTKAPKLETSLSFINTRQPLANTAGIKHDNESNAVQIYSSRTARCRKCISAAAWETMFWTWSENRERPNYF